MATFNISLIQLQIFFLIFLRVGAIIMTIPVFDGRNIPILLKGSLSFAISIILFPILKVDNFPFYADLILFIIGVAGEIVLGIIIGFSVKMLIAGIQLAGQLMGFQMGLAIANVMDPITSFQIPLIAQMYTILSMLLLLIINAHHFFIKAIADSFVMVPIFDFQFTSGLMQHLLTLSGKIFIIAIKVGAPVIVSLLLTSAALGLVARTVPQMNVFIVAMPIKIVIGLFFMGVSFPYLTYYLKELFGKLGNIIFHLLEAM